MSFLLIKQRSFEQEVHAVQQKATEQIQKQGNKNSKDILADYTAADVHTLNPRDIKKVNATEQINKYGVGMLEIPAISLKLPILEGMTQANLCVGAATAKPDQMPKKGNFALLGHYMTNRGLLFGGIQYLQKGNQIKITYKGKQATYEVTTSKIVSYKEGHYMEDPEDDAKILTLITCDSNNQNTTKRLIVQAKLKE